MNKTSTIIKNMSYGCSNSVKTYINLISYVLRLCKSSKRWVLLVVAQKILLNRHMKFGKCLQNVLEGH